jgi:hypothetical protein
VPVLLHGAYALADFNTATVKEGHAKGVIPPVSDPLQGVEEDRKGFSITGITDYSTHSNLTSLR